MRSKLGTKGRLGALITSFVLLVLLIIHAPATKPGVPEKPTASVTSDLRLEPAAVPPAPVEPAAPAEPVKTDPVPEAEPEAAKSDPAPEAPETPPSAVDASLPVESTPETPSEPVSVPAETPSDAGTEPVAEPQESSPEQVEEPAQTAQDGEPEALESSEPSESETPSLPTEPADASVETVPVETPAPEELEENAAASEPEVAPEVVPDAAPAVESEAAPVQDEKPAEEITEGQEEQSTPMQPVVDEPETVAPDAEESVIEGDVALPADTSLKSLGGGVYWLDPGHDLEKELEALPDAGTLVFLTPLPTLRGPGLDHARPGIVIPAANPDDVSDDAVARFVHFAADSPRPVVVAALQGAYRAAYFKGAYLMACRNMGIEDALKEIEPELQESEATRDEIIHRLHGLDVERLK